MGTITYEETNLVSRHRGTMPVILTCPHGGDKQPPGVPNPRTGAGLPSDCRFETNTDRFTRTITRGVAQVLFDVFGEAPYVVIANFDRAFIDANRRQSVHSRIGTLNHSTKSITTPYATSLMRLGRIMADWGFFLTFMGPHK